MYLSQGSRVRSRGNTMDMLPSLKRPAAFLLDIDGTLVITDDIYFAVFQVHVTLPSEQVCD